MFSCLTACKAAVTRCRNHTRARHGLLVAGFAVTLAGCSSPSTAPPGPNHIDGGGATTGDPTSSTSSGVGGSGSGSGSGGSSAGTGPTWTCDGDAAYRATSTAFTAPTAERLALALSELVFAYDARPVAIVLHQNGPVREGAVSATTDGDTPQVFLAPAPALQALDEDAEGFGNVSPQPHGTLTVLQPKGPVSIALEEIRWRARTNNGCGSVWVSLDAIIPATEGATELQLASGKATIAELGTPDGAPDGGVAGYPVHAWFLGESMAFDFSSLPVSP